MTAIKRQVGGDHYKNMGPYQPWEVLDAWLTREQMVGYLLGTAVAYLGRFNVDGRPSKGGVVDMKKAIHTLERAVEIIEEQK